MTWLDSLLELNPQQLAVIHDPMTARYQRAGTLLRYLLKHGVYLGSRPHDEQDDALEIAAWAPPVSGRGPGYYACFRIYLEFGAPSFAVLFAFYDGTDRSPAFRSVDDARAFSSTQEFSDEGED